ncbi:hypothetical protein AGMMS49992_02700 [Clostridia bacterium]|nr:hypothetical protein AGMMS49992_02700 [Clostridia bacterium]
MNGSLRLRHFSSIFIFDDNKVLLLHKYVPFVNREFWLPSAGGHFEKDEMNDPDACLWREVAEEIGLTPADLTDVELRYISSRFDSGEMRYNYYYFGKLAPRVSRDLVNNEGELRWFDFDESRGLEMLPSTRVCLCHYLDEGRHTSHLYYAVCSNEVRIIRLD